MKRIFSLCLILLMICGIVPAEESWMPDTNLRQAVREALEYTGDTELMREEMQHLTYLSVENRGVGNLTGLADASNLRELHISRKPHLGYISVSGFDRPT